MLTAALEENLQEQDGFGSSNARVIPVADISLGYSPRQTKLDPAHSGALQEPSSSRPPSSCTVAQRVCGWPPDRDAFLARLHPHSDGHRLPGRKPASTWRGKPRPTATIMRVSSGATVTSGIGAKYAWSEQSAE
jgi:hypothetical protein